VGNRTIEEFVVAWSRHDAKSLANLMTSDAIYEVVPQRRIMGSDKLEEQVRFMESLSSDFTVALVSELHAGDRCAVEWELAGTNDGPFGPFNLPPSGRRIRIRGVWLIEMGGDRIKACRAYWDFAGLLRQIGVQQTAEVSWQLDGWADESGPEDHLSP
jgi:steroid delta-isomerase-like uncharacterized protein